MYLGMSFITMKYTQLLKHCMERERKRLIAFRLFHHCPSWRLTISTIRAITGTLENIALHGGDDAFGSRSNWPISCCRYAFSLSVINGCVLGLLVHKKNCRSKLQEPLNKFNRTESKRCTHIGHSHNDASNSKCVENNVPISIVVQKEASRKIAHNIATLQKKK